MAELNCGLDFIEFSGFCAAFVLLEAPAFGAEDGMNKERRSCREGGAWQHSKGADND